MQEELMSLKNQAIAQISVANGGVELEQIRIDFFGKNGKITTLIKKIKDVPVSERQQVGLLINETKATIENLLHEQKDNIKTGKDWFDPTIPGLKPRIGHLHLVTQAIREIAKVFEGIGFERVRYPEVEWDYYAFEGLNMPKNHPARDEWETFFIDVPENHEKKTGKIVLTPHTSNAQVRDMESKPLPIRMINIAKTYRRQSDVSHVPMFHQFEGLVVDEGISIVNLKGTLDYFAQSFFGPERKTRLRPYHFQFTEPSFEIDISCGNCNGSGFIADNLNCKLCKAGWLELGGAGMVHPNVLKAGGIDPKKYSGFAFGWGVERTYMMKSGLNIPDVRILYSPDLRFLTQF
jgi:phenylalanyl-tRNA synthetase alpha chain